MWGSTSAQGDLDRHPATAVVATTAPEAQAVDHNSAENTETDKDSHQMLRCNDTQTFSTVFLLDLCVHLCNVPVSKQRQDCCLNKQGLQADEMTEDVWKVEPCSNV